MKTTTTLNFTQTLWFARNSIRKQSVWKHLPIEWTFGLMSGDWKGHLRRKPNRIRLPLRMVIFNTQQQVHKWPSILGIFLPSHYPKISITKRMKKLKTFVHAKAFWARNRIASLLVKQTLGIISRKISSMIVRRRKNPHSFIVHIINAKKTYFTVFFGNHLLQKWPLHHFWQNVKFDVLFL